MTTACFCDIADSTTFWEQKNLHAFFLLASIPFEHMHNYLLLIGTHLEISDNLTQIQHCSSLTQHLLPGKIL